MSPRGLISANRKQRQVSGVRSLHKISAKPEPATVAQVFVQKLSCGAGLPDRSSLPLTAALEETPTLIVQTEYLVFKTSFYLIWLL